MASPRPDQKNEPWKDPGAQPYVRVEKLTKRFGDFVAVDDVTLNIYRNEIFCLLGGSGSGKTTLLRMMAGFERPSEGRIWIDGTDVTGTPPYERPVNMMFQSYALFPHMSVQKNVAFGLRQDKVSAAEIDQRVTEILKLVRMEQFAKRMPHQLSGGQRQRVALARALIIQPPILLLDEPLSALDAHLRVRMQTELSRLHKELGITFIYVTHAQSEAFALADRIVVMNDGRIQQTGRPQDVYREPANAFVAEFMGMNNLISGTAAPARGGLAAIEGPLGRFVVPTGNGSSGGRASFVIAADRVMLTAESVYADGGDTLKGSVIGLEFVGSTQTVFVDVNGSEFRVQKQQHEIENLDLTPGREVYLSWQSKHAWLLPQAA